MCQLCGKCFKQKPYAKTHVESVHVTGLEVKCGICAKIFKNKVSLKTHFRIKHGLAKKSSILSNTAFVKLQPKPKAKRLGVDFVLPLSQ